MTGTVAIERVAHTKLTQEAYRQLCQLLLIRLARPGMTSKFGPGSRKDRSGFSNRQLAKRFGVCRQRVNLIAQELKRNPGAIDRLYGVRAMVKGPPNTAGGLPWVRGTVAPLPAPKDEQDTLRAKPIMVGSVGPLQAMVSLRDRGGLSRFGR